jgi:Asp-tRNA(Asn)/Glu-tRNA(Gln) amidotransferase A subunit family amidase
MRRWVRRLKTAEAIVVGKTNVYFMLTDFGQSAKQPYGVTTTAYGVTNNSCAKARSTRSRPSVMP